MDENREIFGETDLPKEVEKRFKQVLTDYVGKNGEHDIENGYVIVDGGRVAITYSYKKDIYSVVYQKNSTQHKWELKTRPTKWDGIKELASLKTLT